MITEKILDKDLIPLEFCPRCKIQNRIIVYSKFKYFHYNHLNFFAYSLTNYIQCDHCNNILTLDELSVQGESFASDFFKKQKISWTYFSFFIAIFTGLFLSLLFYLF